MNKKLIVLETFEQGMERREGGAIKLFEGQNLPATATEHGLQVTIGDRVRTIPNELVQKLQDQKLVRIEDV